MQHMNSIRLTVTNNLKREIDFLREKEYPTLTDAEIVKLAVGAQAVLSRRKMQEYDFSDLSSEEILLQTAKNFEIGSEDKDEEQF